MIARRRALHTLQAAQQVVLVRQMPVLKRALPLCARLRAAQTLEATICLKQLADALWVRAFPRSPVAALLTQL